MNAPIPASLPVISAPSRPPSAPSILLYGSPGEGKTRSLATLIDAGLDVFVVVTEPNGTDSLLDILLEKPERSAHLFWSEVAPRAASWEMMDAMVRDIGSMSYAAIADLKSGIGKQHMKAFERFIMCFKDFTDDRTGRHFGDVTTWDDTRALVVDSLSGVNKLAREQTVGAKPSMHQGEWGVAMQLEGDLFYKLCHEVRAFFVLIAHADKVANEITGIPETSVAALGNKLAPQMVKHFSEVLQMRKDKDRYYFSTATPGAWSKSRTFAPSDQIVASFGPIVARHHERTRASGAA